jgi:hypothetical protein
MGGGGGEEKKTDRPAGFPAENQIGHILNVLEVLLLEPICSQVISSLLKGVSHNTSSICMTPVISQLEGSNT